MQRKSGFSVLHVALSAVGAILGANTGLGEHSLLDALIGACIGFAIAEWIDVRGRLLTLEEEFVKLRADRARRDDGSGVRAVGEAEQKQKQKQKPEQW